MRTTFFHANNLPHCAHFEGKNKHHPRTFIIAKRSSLIYCWYITAYREVGKHKMYFQLCTTQRASCVHVYVCVIMEVVEKENKNDWEHVFRLFNIGIVRAISTTNSLSGWRYKRTTSNRLSDEQTVRSILSPLSLEASKWTFKNVSINGRDAFAVSCI